jgi:hypothetical protein
LKQKGWEDALDSETATPAAYIGSKLPDEEEQEVEVQGEDDDYDAEEDITVLEEEIHDEDQYTTPDDDLQKEFENALEKFDEMSDSDNNDKNEDEETTDSEESTSDEDDDDDSEVEDRKLLIIKNIKRIFIYFLNV